MRLLVSLPVSPQRYRVVYQVRLAHLHLGRPVSQAVRQCTALVTTNEVAVLLVDLFEQHRGQPGFLGLHLLRVSRRLPARGPVTAPATEASKPGNG